MFDSQPTTEFFDNGTTVGVELPGAGIPTGQELVISHPQQSIQVKQRTRPSPKTIVREVSEFGIITIIMALFVLTFLVQGMKVPTGSMQNTIQIGDHVLVNKFDVVGSSHFFPLLPHREIRRGDIIVFKYPGNQFDPDEDLLHGTRPFETNYVKRVIGLPGDVIEIEGRAIRVNGSQIREHVTMASEPCPNAPDFDPCNNAPLIPLREVDGEPETGTYSVYYEPGPEQQSDGFPAFQKAGNGKAVRVPPDSFFVMGDNRDNSEDSRYWGFVKKEYVIGRAMMVYWSTDESTPQTNLITSFFTRARWKRIMIPLK